LFQKNLAEADKNGMKIYGIGTDITECERIRKMIEKHGDYFTERVFTDWENSYFRSQKQFLESCTGRWCAKEAILKAIGTGWVRGIAWRDVEVRNLTSGAPQVWLGGGALKAVQQRGISDILITISHCSSHATATAIALTDGSPFPEERSFDRPDDY